jgi:hypothetical protein
MKAVRKHDLAVSEIRRFLEPGPIVLVSSAYRGESNIMTMGWHMVMGFTRTIVRTAKLIPPIYGNRFSSMVDNVPPLPRCSSSSSVADNS